jgi:hypothetical protein
MELQAYVLEGEQVAKADGLLCKCALHEHAGEGKAEET